MKTLKKCSLVIIFLGIVGTGYSQDKSGLTTFDFNQPFLLEIGKEVSNGNLTVTFVDRRDVMGQNLDENNTIPTSYYTYILKMSVRSYTDTFYINSYQIGEREATKDLVGYKLTIVDDNVKRLKLKSSQKGRVLKLQVSKVYSGNDGPAYSEDHQPSSTNFDFNKPFLLMANKPALNGDLIINFFGAIDVMGVNLNANDPTPTSYYSYHIQISHKKERTNFYVDSYNIGKKEATLEWEGFQFTVVDDNVESLKLNSSQEGKIIKFLVVKKAE